MYFFSNQQSLKIKQSSRKGGGALCLVSDGPLLGFVAVQVFEGFEFLDEGLVLVLQHCHAVLQTLDVFLLLPATLARCLPVGHGQHA